MNHSVMESAKHTDYNTSLAAIIIANFFTDFCSVTHVQTQLDSLQVNKQLFHIVCKMVKPIPKCCYLNTVFSFICSLTRVCQGVLLQPLLTTTDI